MKATGARQIVRRGLRSETIGLIAVGVCTALAAALGLAGQLAALFIGGSWPSWRTVGLNPLRPVLHALTNPSDPMRSWPGIHEPPPAWLYWLLAFSILALVATCATTSARLQRAPVPGFASRRDVARRLGGQALIKQAPRLRPALAKATTRPRPEQLGTHLGRDVHTGIDCYSSVRQSRFVVGPSESGKTSSVVIPEALDHDGPLLAPSSRADVMAATWLPRSERGAVHLFDPLHQTPALPLVRWDPVRDCVDPAVAIRRAEALTASVDMTGVSNGEAWRNRGRSILRNLLHAAALGGHDIRTVLRWTYDQTSVEPAAILDRRSPTPSWAEQQHGVITTPERQRAGYYMAVEAAMDLFAHPAVLHACTPHPDHHFDTTTFLDTGQPTLYLHADRNQAIAVSDLLAALLDDVLFHARHRAQRSPNNRLDPPLRPLIDEAPHTATLTQLPDLLADGGGRGIPTTVVVQDRAQAAERWGRDKAASMWGAATIRLVLPGVAGHDELRELAAYFTDYDEQIPTLTTSPTGGSTQHTLRPREAMTAASVRALPAFHALVIAAGGLDPVLTELQPYFHRTDAKLTARSERAFYEALNTGGTLL
jgi:type IV secretion system protein VirD4